MCKKLIYFVSVVLLLGSVSQAADIQWTDLGADHLWSTPENWEPVRIPTLADEVLIDVPAAAAPNGPVIQDGIDAKAKGILTEAAGEPTLTITGGTLEVAEWIWLGDGADSFGIWDMTGGAVTVANEFELGWDGGAGTLTITGGTISAGEAVIPTGSGAFGELYLYGGTYNVTKAGGLSVKENGLIDITEGTLVLEGDDTAKINDLITAGLITAYGGAGQFELDFDGRNPGKTTLAAIPEPVPTDPGADGLVAYYAFENDATDSSGNGLDGTILGDAIFADGAEGMALDFNGIDDVVELGKFDVIGQITLAAWVRADDFEINDARIITKAQEWGGDDHWWMISTISETSLRFRLKTDDGQGTATLVSDPALEAGVWAHVAATWDGSMMRIYKDGVEVASQEKGGSVVAVEPNVSVAIGSQPSDAFASDPSHVAKFFDGLIDEVRIYERALSEGEVLYLAGKRATPVDPGTDALVAFYALENDVLDGSGNGNDGTIVGNPTFVEGPAGYGMALEFDGESYVDCGNDASLDITGPISMSIWIRPGTDGSVETAPLCKADASAGWSWQLRYGWNTDKPTIMGFQFNATGGRVWVYVEQELPIGEWYHIVASHDGAIVKCYLDGVETDSAPMTDFAGGPSTLLIGSDGWRDDWIGAIDEVAIYNRALSTGEARYLAGYRAPVDPGSEGLVAYYALDNDANDSSGNNLHGTLVGDPGFVEGIAGMALELDGVDDRVAIADDATFDAMSEKFTITAWIKLSAEGTTDRRPILSKELEPNPDGRGWEFKVNNGSLAMQLYSPVEGEGKLTVAGSASLEADQWYHVVGIYQADGPERFYINGVLDHEQELVTALQANASPANIGAYIWSPTGYQTYFAGLIDEVRAYSRVLSEPEVRYLAGDD